MARSDGRGLARATLEPLALLGSFKRVVERPAHPGQPWVHFNDSLCALAGEKLERVALPPLTTSEPVLGIAARRAGGLWVVFASGVTWLEENGRWGVSHQFGGLPVGWEVTVTEDRRGNLWLGTPLRGLFCLSSEGQMRNLLETGEVPFTWIRQILEDRQGSLFLATDANGLVRLSRRAFRLWSEPETGPTAAVNAVAPAFDGGVWIGTNGKGLFHLTPAGRFEHLAVIDESTVAFAQTLLEDKRQRLWVGTYDQGLLCFDAAQGTLLHRWYNPDIWSEVRALAEDDTGLWASTFIGVYHDTPAGDWRRASAVKARILGPWSGATLLGGVARQSRRVVRPHGAGCPGSARGASDRLLPRGGGAFCVQCERDSGRPPGTALGGHGRRRLVVQARQSLASPGFG